MEQPVKSLTHQARDEVAISSNGQTSFPALIEQQGPAARFAWDEFFEGQIRNQHTRKAYLYSVRRFLEHCQENGTEDLTRITPAQVGRYLDQLPLSATTKKLHLSALRNFFDQLVLRHLIILNPALSVRSERVQVQEGKTPAIPIPDARKLIESINTTHVVGLRDRAIIGILAYTIVRASAVAKLTCQDFYQTGDQHFLNFAEKNGKTRVIPVRYDLHPYLLAYQSAANLADQSNKSSFFRSTIRRTKQLTDRPLTGDDILRIVKRRLRDVGLSEQYSPHSFRTTGITDLLDQGVPLDEVQDLVGHADPRTTRLYDRRKREVKRNLVERISI